MCMENHFYSIDGKVRRQLEGGAIGSVLTGDNARLYMLRWDSKYRLKLKKLGINLDLYVRYVDDTVVVCSAINRGWRYCSVNNRMEYSRDIFDCDTMTDEDRTAKILSEIHS